MPSLPKLPPTDYYFNPETTGYSFEERTGDPDSFSAGIGRVVLNFAELDRQLSAGIRKCLGLDAALGHTVTAELSFRVKVHVLSSLIRERSLQLRFNVADNDPITEWGKIVAQCFRAEELRNQILHSEWSGPYLRDLKATRRKYTAKASRGLTEHLETVDAARLLDIADYIIGVALFVEEYFLTLDEGT